MGLIVRIASLICAQLIGTHRRQVLEQGNELIDRNRLAARGDRLVNIGIDGSESDLLHGTVFGRRLLPKRLRLLITEPERHSHDHMIPYGITRFAGFAARGQAGGVMAWGKLNSWCGS